MEPACYDLYPKPSNIIFPWTPHRLYQRHYFRNKATLILEGLKDKLVQNHQVILSTLGGGNSVPKMRSQNLLVTPKPFS